MSTEKRRKGSLAFYHNSKRGLSTLIPAGKKDRLVAYYLKVKMDQDLFDRKGEKVLLPYTLLRRIDLSKTAQNHYELKFSELNVKKARKKNVVRTIDSDSVQQIYHKIENADYLDVTGLTKGRGTTGIIQRRKVKKGKRKGSRANCTRRYGSRGHRTPAKVVPTQPFAGKHGNSLRTQLNCKLLKQEILQNVVSKNHYSKEGHFLFVKGSLPGTINSVLKVRPSIRK